MPKKNSNNLGEEERRNQELVKNIRLHYSTLNYKKLISTGDSIVEKKKYKKASDNYQNAIEIIDSIISIDQPNLTQRIEKFELIEKMHPTIAKDLIPILIKKKLKFLRNTKKKHNIIINKCIFCGAELKGTEKYCPKCAKELFVHELIKDISERTLNWDFLLDFFDTNLSIAKNLIIYKKQFKNINSDFAFPLFKNEFYLKIVLRILQFTNAIQKINHPEVLTNSSILRVHDLLVGNKDFNGEPLKNPWGFFKYEVSNFSELELNNAIKETRKDVTITYKDARPNFDYDIYFWSELYNESEEMYKMDLTNPQCDGFLYNHVIQNKIVFYFTKIKKHMTQFTVYLLESKKIEIV